MQVFDLPETKNQALADLNKLLSGSKVPAIRRQKPKWLVKHLTEESTDNYSEVIDLCRHIIKRGWA